MPRDENGKTKGCAFIEYSRREVWLLSHMCTNPHVACLQVVIHYKAMLQEASRAVKEMDGYRLDKSHVIWVFLVDDLDRLEHVADQYSAPPAVPFDSDVCTHVTVYDVYRSSALSCSDVWFDAETSWNHGLDDGSSWARSICYSA